MSVSGSIKPSRSGTVWALVPALMLVMVAGPYLDFLLPATSETVAESYQPMRTLSFFHPSGTRYHKWGPLPNFINAPVYGTMLCYWYVTDQFESPSGDYPYGLVDPHRHIGAMLWASRLLTLGLLAGSLVWLTREVIRATDRLVLGPALVIGLCVVSPWILHAATNTKPDGMMMAFIILFLSAYLKQCIRGFDIRSGLWMTVGAVLTVSCKELVIPMLGSCFAALGLSELHRLRGDVPGLKRTVRGFVICAAVGGVVYALLNIVYAPGVWMARMHNLFGGTLKDSEIWAAPDQTKVSYLLSSVQAVISVTGWLGAGLLSGCVIGLFTRPTRAFLLALVPFVSHVVLVTLNAGYMPTRFMLPVGAALVLPVAVLLRKAGSDPSQNAKPKGRLASATCVASILIMLIPNSIGGIKSFMLMRRFAADHLIEGFVTKNVDKHTTVYPASMHPRHAGSTRLTYLGYQVDDRPLGYFMHSPTDRPTYVFSKQRLEDWLREFSERPARAREFEMISGYDYTSFTSMESIGYEKLATLGLDALAERPRNLSMLWPYSERIWQAEAVNVYRRVESTRGN